MRFCPFTPSDARVDRPRLLAPLFELSLDARSRKVRRLESEPESPGVHETRWRHNRTIVGEI